MARCKHRQVEQRTDMGIKQKELGQISSLPIYNIHFLCIILDSYSINTKMQLCYHYLGVIHGIIPWYNACERVM